MFYKFLRHTCVKKENIFAVKLFIQFHESKSEIFHGKVYVVLTVAIKCKFHEIIPFFIVEKLPSLLGCKDTFKKRYVENILEKTRSRHRIILALWILYFDIRSFVRRFAGICHRCGGMKGAWHHSYCIIMQITSPTDLRSHGCFDWHKSIWYIWILWARKYETS